MKNYTKIDFSTLLGFASVHKKLISTLEIMLCAFISTSLGILGYTLGSASSMQFAWVLGISFAAIPCVLLPNILSFNKPGPKLMRIAQISSLISQIVASCLMVISAPFYFLNAVMYLSQIEQFSILTIVIPFLFAITPLSFIPIIKRKEFYYFPLIAMLPFLFI